MQAGSPSSRYRASMSPSVSRPTKLFWRQNPERHLHQPVRRVASTTLVEDGMQLIEDIVQVYSTTTLRSRHEVLVASVRHPHHVHQAALIGAHVATMPFERDPPDVLATP